MHFIADWYTDLYKMKILGFCLGLYTVTSLICKDLYFITTTNYEQTWCLASTSTDFTFLPFYHDKLHFHKVRLGTPLLYFCLNSQKSCDLNSYIQVGCSEPFKCLLGLAEPCNYPPQTDLPWILTSYIHPEFPLVMIRQHLQERPCFSKLRHDSEIKSKFQ